MERPVGLMIVGQDRLLVDLAYGVIDPRLRTR